VSRAGLGLSRRAFIMWGAAAGGTLPAGLLIGDLMHPQLSAPEDVEVYNWITVAPDNVVTIRIAQVEMGQGAMTSMAQLFAEELELDWHRIRTEFISIAVHLKRGKVYGRTNTAASEGVSHSQVLLRMCAAQIRTMFITAAANRLAAPQSELAAKKSMIVHTPTGRTLTYGELAADAAKIPAPDPRFMKLKEPKHWDYIGKSIKRIDIPSKTDGSAVFGIDVKLPGMKHAAIAISPVFGGTLKSFDAGAALSRPGVQKVVKINGGSFGVDDALAVVADHWWQAKKAVDAMPKEWDEGTLAVIDSAAILANLQAGLEDVPDGILRINGNPEAAMASAAYLLEADYFVPYLEHATMEPMNCTALVTDDKFEIWAPTQLPEPAIQVAAKVAGMPVDKGDLHVTQIGGGFGRRQQSDFIAQAVQIAKAMKGTPIKLLWTREDTMRHGFYRPASLSRMKGTLDSNGSILAWWHRIVSPSDDRVKSQLGSDSLLYAIPNMIVDFVVRRSGIPEGQMRGVSFATQGFVAQSFIDELAKLAGKDTYAFQRVLLDPARTPAAVPVAIPESAVENPLPRERAARLRAVLDEAARKALWGQGLGPNRGRGIAVEEEAGSYFAVVIEVTLDGQGWFRVDRAVVVGDAGVIVNPNSANAQVEGSVAFGLTSAMYGEITISGGSVVQGNFHEYQMLRIQEMPKVEIYWLSSPQTRWGGIGEPVVAAVIPALTNAIYDAGGPRIRSLPLKNQNIVRRQ
jgi:isoquinoline 1-oxidoreductase beta subunit